MDARPSARRTWSSRLVKSMRSVRPGVWRAIRVLVKPIQIPCRTARSQPNHKPTFFCTRTSFSLLISFSFGGSGLVIFKLQASDGATVGVWEIPPGSGDDSAPSSKQSCSVRFCLFNFDHDHPTEPLSYTPTLNECLQTPRRSRCAS
jgi:hypothetical protein